MLISDWSSDVCPSDLGVRARQLRDIRSRRLLLRCRLREDRRTIARPAIRPLPVELRGIVRGREIDAQQRAVAHSGRIVGDPDRFGMAGLFGADIAVAGGRLAAPGIVAYQDRKSVV